MCTDPTELLETTFRVIDFLDPVLGVSESSLEGVFERFEPGIELEDTCSCAQLSARYLRMKRRGAAGQQTSAVGLLCGSRHG